MAVVNPINYSESTGQALLQGLRAGSAIQGFRSLSNERDQIQQQQERQNQFYTTLQNTPPDQLHTLRTQYPDFADMVQKEIGIQNAEHATFVNNALNKISVAAASGNPAAVQESIAQNKSALMSFGVDPQEAIQMAQNDPQQFNRLLSATRLATMPIDKQVATQQKQQELDETVRNNNMTNARGIQGHNLAAQRLSLDRQKFELDVQQAYEKSQALISEAPKLSVNMEKSIETAVNDATASTNSASSMRGLAQQFRDEKPTTGLFGNANNMFAKLTGSDTTLRDLRIRQNALVNSQVLKFLPPGPATDRDVEIVRQGAPTDMDNPAVVARWLDAMANLEEQSAKFNSFKAEWMSANGNPGQSRYGGQILGMDVKKGESMGQAAKRYMSQQTSASDNPNTVEAKPSEQSSSGYQSLWGD